jgi:hypothetical protein
MPIRCFEAGWRLSAGGSKKGTEAGGLLKSFLAIKLINIRFNKISARHHAGREIGLGIPALWR